MVEITYFSDVLCIWAYASQARVDAVKDTFGDAVRIEPRFCSVFARCRKIASAWNDKGGYAGFNSHLRQVAERFPHIEVHPEIWLKGAPLDFGQRASFHESGPATDRETTAPGSQSVASRFDQVMWTLRCAFFRV